MQTKKNMSQIQTEKKDVSNNKYKLKKRCLKQIQTEKKDVLNKYKLKKNMYQTQNKKNMSQTQNWKNCVSNTKKKKKN